MAKEKTKTELPTVMEGELKARLIKLREDAGYDIPQLARALCLSEETVINLENESFDELAEPPYIRGYLRNYAKLGDENPDELIKRYESLRGADATELDYQIKASSTIISNSTKRISPIWGQVILLALLVGGIALAFTIPGVKNWVDNTWTNFSSQLAPADASNNPSLLGNLPVPVPLPGEELAIPTQQNNQATTTPDSTPASTEEVSNTETAATKVTEETVATEASIESTANSTDTKTATDLKTQTSTSDTTAETVVEETVAINPEAMINIKLAFNKEVWLRIKDKDNKTVFEGLNKAGTDKSLSLKKPLTFRVGNAQGLSMSIDDKPVDIGTYINGSIANFTLE